MLPGLLYAGRKKVVIKDSVSRKKVPDEKEKKVNRRLTTNMWEPNLEQQLEIGRKRFSSVASFNDLYENWTFVIFFSSFFGGTKGFPGHLIWNGTQVRGKKWGKSVSDWLCEREEEENRSFPGQKQLLFTLLFFFSVFVGKRYLWLLHLLTRKEGGETTVSKRGGKKTKRNLELADTHFDVNIQNLI